MFRTEANFVRVDVYPLKDGKPLQGLKLEDFEVLEDGVAQKIEAFEHVVIRSAGPQETRREPSSQRESLQEATNPRNRVFVIFLDTTHVSVERLARDQGTADPVDRQDPWSGRSRRGHDAGDGCLSGRARAQDAGHRRFAAHELAVGRRFSLMNDEREDGV